MSTVTVIITGFIAVDSTRNLYSGRAIHKFSIPVKQKDKMIGESTEWYNCIRWTEADSNEDKFLSDWLKKGTFVKIVGDLTTSKFVKSEGKGESVSMNVNILSIDILSRPSKIKLTPVSDKPGTEEDMPF